ncbi:MAG: hypothetical protein AAGI50_20395 [Pseudomonadota bacterium]
MARYAVIRVPKAGRPTLAPAPNDFATEAEAEARIEEIEERLTRRVQHAILRYEGDLAAAVAARAARFG